MATKTQLEFLSLAFKEAKQAGHIFPNAAACEACVESSWGTSQLYVEDRNCFGMKQHEHPVFVTVTLPTKEFLGNKWVTVNAPFVKYPTLADCFADRMNTLRTLAPAYPHYAAALAATNPEDFLTQVSRTWSTGPTRGAQCIAILHSHPEIF